MELDVRMNPTLSRTTMNVLYSTTSSLGLEDTLQFNHGGAIFSTTFYPDLFNEAFNMESS